jgi:hypothetical protein
MYILTLYLSPIDNIHRHTRLLFRSTQVIHMASLFFSTTDEQSRAFSYKVKKGELIRVHKGIYTDATYADLESTIRNKWYEIVNHLFPNAIAAYRTAHELRPIEGKVYIIQHGLTRRMINIGKALTIHVDNGNTSELIEPFVPNLFRASPARQYLENLTLTRSTPPKALGREWVEQQLSAALRHPNKGEIELNSIRDRARTFANANGFEKEFATLNGIISSLLSTHQDGSVLTNELAIATSKGQPFDPVRMGRFEALANYLQRCDLLASDYSYNKSSWQHLSFYESYFSNYIEGTEFEIDEAEDIVFSGKNVSDRYEDSHDVLSVYESVSDYQWMSITPSTPEELIKCLTECHYSIMNQRPDKRPGLFKSKVNKAGSSVFVKPDEVIGTLTKSFFIYKSLNVGQARAIFIHFLVSECHPFDDGNGRLSRIMMNKELHAVDLHKIIMPTVHRDSYLNGLRQATRHDNFKTLVKVLYQLQHYTASINWTDYGDARATIEAHNAHLLPDDGVATFNKAIREFTFIPPL